MDWLIALFSTPNSIAHILLAYSIVIALGMALGKIKIFGVSLGVTFVLFTGLLLNYLGMKVDPTVLGFIRDFGLILFVFFIIYKCFLLQEKENLTTMTTNRVLLFRHYKTF